MKFAKIYLKDFLNCCPKVVELFDKADTRIDLLMDKIDKKDDEIQELIGTIREIRGVDCE